MIAACSSVDEDLFDHNDTNRQDLEEIVITRAYQLEMFEKSMHTNVIATVSSFWKCHSC